MFWKRNKNNIKQQDAAHQDEPLQEDKKMEEAQPVDNAAEDTEASWLQRLTKGLSKSSSKLTEGLTSLVTKKKLDQETLEELEELLIMSDMGVQCAVAITEDIAKDRLDKDITLESLRALLAEKIADILAPVAVPLVIEEKQSPTIIMVCGVNGNGKTTTIGKMAKQWQDKGKKVMLVACDTFRAAAVEQLEVWSQRAECMFIKGEPEADAASVAYQAIEKAKAEAIDIVLIDTAGRLHNKANLMDELKKIVRVIHKLDDTAPHHTLLVLDATTGQNANSQMKNFKEAVDISGLIVTKLDGTARGGVVLSLAQEFNVPIHAIGVGESLHDLQPFDAKAFANGLVSDNM